MPAAGRGTAQNKAKDPNLLAAHWTPQPYLRTNISDENLLIVTCLF